MTLSIETYDEAGAEQKTLLATKSFIPGPPDRLLSRPRLSAALQYAHGSSRLVSVCAPAGFGKTTAVSEWLHQYDILQQEKVGWFSIDESDNEPSLFWSYIIQALETAQPGLTGPLLGLWRTQPPPNLEYFLTRLLNQLAAWGQPFTLVLDDYHLINQPAIQAGLAFLLDHQPPNLRIVVTSRTELPAELPLARLRMRGQLTELWANDLRFTLDETASFLQGVIGLDLLPRQVAALELKTEGWIAALKLAGLLLQNHPDVAGFLQTFDGNQRFVLDYLASEVLERQPPAIQSFLLQTSIVDRLTASLVEELTGCEDGQAMLSELEKANLFLIRLDDAQGWYRYHHLFQQYLRQRLAQTQAEHIPLLHRWAARWYDEHKMAVPAVEHALAGADFDYAARLIDVTTRYMYERGELKTLLDWLASLPETYVFDRPHMSCNYAWVLVLLGRPEEAVPYVEAEAKTLPTHVEQYGLDAETERAIRGEIAAIWAFIERTRGNFSQSIALSEQALALVRPDQLFLRCAIVVGQAQSYLALEKGAAAFQKFIETEALARQVDSGYFMLVAVISQARLQLQQGRLKAALATCQRAVQATRFEMLPIMGLAYGTLGQLQYEFNRLEEAATNLRRGLELLDSTNGPEMIAAYLQLARIQMAQGDMDAAANLLERATEVARENGLNSSDTPLDLGWVEYWLATGQLAQAQFWANNLSPTSSVPTSRLRLGWVRLAEEDWPAALSLATELTEYARQTDRTGLLIASLVLKATTLERQGTAQAEAQAALRAALKLAEPEGYVQVFVVGGEAIARLLHRLGGPDSPYLTLLKAACPFTPAQSSTRPKSANSPALIEPLTERERDILRLLATTSLTSTEIAQELSVAVSTVRTHIKNIYGKLDVQNRLQAIKRSEDMGLL